MKLLLLFVCCCFFASTVSHGKQIRFHSLRTRFFLMIDSLQSIYIFFFFVVDVVVVVTVSPLIALCVGLFYIHAGIYV